MVLHKSWCQISQGKSYCFLLNKIIYIESSFQIIVESNYVIAIATLSDWPLSD